MKNEIGIGKMACLSIFPYLSIFSEAQFPFKMFKIIAGRLYMLYLQCCVMSPNAYKNDV